MHLEFNMPNISIIRLRELERAERTVKQHELREAAKDAANELMECAGLMIAMRAANDQLTIDDKSVLREVKRRVPTAFAAWAQLTNPKLNEVGGLS
jgi:hypothetical protein